MHWLTVLKVGYFGMFSATLLYYWLTGGGIPRDYEELCAQLGASLLWFATWPMSLWLWSADHRWKKINARKNDIADLRESLEDVVDSPTHDALASNLNTKYKIVCDGHPVEDCTHKRRARRAVLN